MREPRHLSARELPVEFPLLDGRRHEGLRGLGCCNRLFVCCLVVREQPWFELNPGRGEGSTTVTPGLTERGG